MGSFQISDGFVGIVVRNKKIHIEDTYENLRVARRQMADVFAKGSPAGGASPAPTETNFRSAQRKSTERIQI